MSAQMPSNQSPVTGEGSSAPAATPTAPINPRKRRASTNANSPPAGLTSASSATEATVATAPPPTPETAAKKKGRTNTPWTPEEEQKLQQMRGENKGWSEIAKVILKFSSRAAKIVADVESHFQQEPRGASRSIGTRSASLRRPRASRLAFADRR